VDLDVQFHRILDIFNISSLDSDVSNRINNSQISLTKFKDIEKMFISDQFRLKNRTFHQIYNINLFQIVQPKVILFGIFLFAILEFILIYSSFNMSKLEFKKIVRSEYLKI